MSRTAKLILLGVVIAAILYVLISPLPELAATSTLKVPAMAFGFSVIFLVAPQGPFRRNLTAHTANLLEEDVFLARSCVRLC